MLMSWSQPRNRKLDESCESWTTSDKATPNQESRIERTRGPCETEPTKRRGDQVSRQVVLKPSLLKNDRGSLSTRRIDRRTCSISTKHADAEITQQQLGCHHYLEVVDSFRMEIHFIEAYGPLTHKLDVLQLLNIYSPRQQSRCTRASEIQS